LFLKLREQGLELKTSSSDTIKDCCTSQLNQKFELRERVDHYTLTMHIYNRRQNENTVCTNPVRYEYPFLGTPSDSK
jgi:hypothetical protein